MEVYTTEEQQVEAIKNWWKENGKAVILGAVVGLGGLYGWRYYQGHLDTSAENASDAYNVVVTALASDGAEAAGKAEAFIKDNADTSYAAMTSLQLAKVQAEAGELAAAARQLRWVTDNAKDESMQTLAQIRLARVEAQQGNLDAALAELAKVTSESWAGTVDELRGDFQLKKGDVEAARTSYELALQNGAGQVVQMKLDNLAK